MSKTSAIPRAILSKAGPLTQDEWHIMRSYTEIGYRMAQSIDEPVLAQAILAFREHWDGQGYPYGLKGEKIPLVTRIVSILDAYDVTTHGRPYKARMSRDEAVKELRDAAQVSLTQTLSCFFCITLIIWLVPQIYDQLKVRTMADRLLKQGWKH